MNFYGQSLATGGGSEDPIDKILFYHYLKDVRNGTAVEAGANDGLYLSTCRIFEEIGWRVINIEASLFNYERLIQNRPKSVNIQAALSYRDKGFVEVCHFDFDNGGMDGSREHLTHLTKNKTPTRVDKVPARRYDSLIQEPVDLLVLDVEGMELEVLTGMENTLFWPKIICIEYAHIGAVGIWNVLSGRYNQAYIDNLNMVLLLK